MHVAPDLLKQRPASTSPAPLDGVNLVDVAAAPDRLRRVAGRLVEEGVRFGPADGKVPWLVAAQPFLVPRRLRNRLLVLGAAIFRYYDRLQELYEAGEPAVRGELDGLVPRWLRAGRERRIEMFRLDVLLEGGEPRITEVEEIFGNAGKIVAMAAAYGLPRPPIVDFLAARGVRSIFVCDDYPQYLSEVGIVARALSRLVGEPVAVSLGSSFVAGPGAVWRFAGVAEMERYGPAFVRALREARVDFVNPMFHGFGSKAALALLYDARVADRLEDRLGRRLFNRLRAAVPKTVRLAPDSIDPQQLLRERKRLVLKVVECPSEPVMAWGSRGVFFGERSSPQWARLVADGLAGGIRLPCGDNRTARLAVSELVEADRQDVLFLHPDGARLCLMPRARCRLGPIFVRDAAGVRLAGGHATFVNTSRKVHLGHHAVCAPLSFG